MQSRLDILHSLPGRFDWDHKLLLGWDLWLAVFIPSLLSIQILFIPFHRGFLGKNTNIQHQLTVGYQFSMEKIHEKKRIFGTIDIIWKRCCGHSSDCDRENTTEKRWKCIASTVSICMILPDIFESKNKTCKLKPQVQGCQLQSKDVYVMMDQSSPVLGPTWNLKTREQHHAVSFQMHKIVFHLGGASANSKVSEVLITAATNDHSINKQISTPQTATLLQLSSKFVRLLPVHGNPSRFLPKRKSLWRLQNSPKKSPTNKCMYINQISYVLCISLQYIYIYRI